MFEKFLEATAFLAILCVTGLCAWSLHAVTDQAESAEIVRLGITAICSLAGGGAIGYAAGRMRKEEKS